MGWVWRSLRPVDCRARRQVAKSTAWRSLGATCVTLVCVILVSCGGEPRLAPPPEPSPEIDVEMPEGAAATPLSATLEPRIGRIVWATETDPATHAPIEPVSSYRPDAPRIIAAVQTLALTTGSVVEATWEYNDTSLDAFTTRLVPTESGAERWLNFHIARDPEVPWPVGRYEVTVSLDGTPMQQAAVDVSEQT